MSGAALPASLLVLTLALALSSVEAATIRRCLLLLVAVAVPAALLEPRVGAAWPTSAACWGSVTVTALAVYLPRGLRPPFALLLAANAGLWCGLLAAGDRTAFAALALAPLALLGRQVVDRGYAIALKVAASWLLAVAILALSLPLFTTPGNVPDHMD